ncbi:hypothetical protein BDW22DRAFT_1407605 [Trametopsis cervina]|nr:hypothetical protein BDW22DRAFT_1407605 [Trametopsis cervina]
MSPPEFSLRLQEGITGGFAPPTPSAILTVTGSPNKADLHITSAIRPHGTPSLQDALPKSLSKSEPGVDESITELYTILKSLPTEKPAGSEDIYRLDTSIAFASEGFTWQNGGPQGCGGGQSSVRATAEEKARFKRAVEIVNKLVEQAK